MSERLEKRDQVWQHRRIQAERESLRKQTQGLSTSEILNLSLKHRRDRSPLSQLRCYLLLVEALRRDVALLPDHAALLKARAEKILRENRVTPHSSRLSFLYGDLYSSVRADNPMGRAWSETITRYGVKSDQNAESRIQQAQTLLRWGDVPGAMAILGESETPKELALRARAYRLAGDCFAALALCESAESSSAVHWEKLSAKTQLAQDPRELVDAATTAEQRAEAALWCLSVRSREFLPLAKMLSDGPSLSSADFVRELLRCYDASLSIPARLEILGQALKHMAQAPCASEEILMWAAATRWLFRIRQTAFARQTFARYRALGLAMSSGQASDPLGLVSDIAPEGRDKQPSSLRTGIARSWQFSKLAFELTTVLGRSRFQQLFGNQEKNRRLKQAEIEKLTRVLVAHLSQLRGPIMKLGQTASYFGLDLPESSARQLDSLQDRAEPMPFAEVQRIVEHELGGKLAQHFTVFSPVPIGVGSIGQVHRGRLPDGSEVAIKVRFPGIQEAIRHDTRLLRWLAPVLNLFARHFPISALVTELEQKLLEEANYRREAKLQQQFAQKFAGHPVIAVPKVWAALTTESVLVTEFIEAPSFNHFIATASEEERGCASQALLEFVVGSCRDGLFNTDLHPGNFLWKSGRLYCLDFGSVKEWSHEYSAPWMGLMRASAERDFERFKKELIAMRMVADERNLDFKYIYDVETAGPLGQMGNEGLSRFSHQAIQSEFLRLFTPKNPSLGHITIEPQYLLGFRAYFGSICLLSSLGARCDYRNLMSRLFAATA